MVRGGPRQALRLCRLFLAGALVFAHAEGFPQGDSTRSWAGHPLAGEVAVEASVEAAAVPLDQTLTLTVRAVFPGDMDRYEFQWPSAPELTRFDVVGTSEANVVGDQHGQVTTSKQYRFILKPVAQGKSRIGPVKLFYVDKLTQKESSLTTQAIVVEVTAPLQKRSAGRGGPLTLLVAGCVALGLLGALLWWRKRRRRPAPVVLPEQTRSPVELALEELEAVPKVHLEGGTKECYRLLSHVFRRYIDRAFAVRTAELTTRDIIDALRTKGLDDEAVAGIEDILQVCDVAKYAPQEPSAADLAGIISRARDHFSRRVDGD